MRNINTKTLDITSIEEIHDELIALGENATLEDELQAIQSMYVELMKYLELEIPTNSHWRRSEPWD